MAHNYDPLLAASGAREVGKAMEPNPKEMHRRPELWVKTDSAAELQEIFVRAFENALRKHKNGIGANYESGLRVAVRRRREKDHNSSWNLWL